MDETDLLITLVVILCCMMLWLLITSRADLKFTGEEVQDRMEAIEEGMRIVGGVLEQLPSLVPKFELQNNPLSQILEFITGLRGEAPDSYEGASLRDPSGMFADGDEGTESSSGEGPESP